jgi:hypothetical protein
MGPRQGDPGEGVEDPAAGAALEVHHEGTMAAVNPQVLPLCAARASQAAGMEQFDELGRAGSLVPIIDQREVQGHGLQGDTGYPRRGDHRSERS